MHKKLIELCVSLDSLALAVRNSSVEDRTFYESINYLHPAVTRTDLAVIASQLSERLKFADVEEIDASIAEAISDFPRKLKLLEANTIPNFYGGAGANAIPAYTLTINVLNQILSPILIDTDIDESKRIALKFIKDVRAYKTRFDNAIVDVAEIETKMSKINHAHAAADALPEDLQSLELARKKVDDAQSTSLNSASRIENILQDSVKALQLITEQKIAAEKLIEKCEDAFRITTSKGLAGAFDQRAGMLARSMWVWVGGLVAALLIGGLIGHERVIFLSNFLASKELKDISIWPHLILSLAALGGPIWFSWIATKQIGQRFRLAEDYGFKSSVAKSYEGYRKEAIQLQPELATRLFSSALTRLEEAPLRLIETQSHGSPFHELANSKLVKFITRTDQAKPEQKSVKTLTESNVVKEE